VKVLVTDAHFKNALCAIRNLGRHGCDVWAGSERRWAQGFYSRACRHHVTYPPPWDRDRFLPHLRDLAAREGIDVILPIGDRCVSVLSEYREELGSGVRVPVAAWDTMQVAASKARTVELATRLGIAVPRTYASRWEIERYPVVVKASQGSGWVRYVNRPTEFPEAIGTETMIQEYVPGEARALFALYDRGTAVAVFQHRRLREFPITGGASTAAESIHDPALEELGLRLLDALHWHGVAMVEFKWNPSDGRYTLMEVNPKFWGSLDLAVAAGVEFPWLAVRLAMGEVIRPAFDYPVGIRFQWVFDELLHVAARPSAVRAVFRDARSRAVHRDLEWGDLKPNLFRGVTVLATLLKRLAQGSLRYPHGVPDSPDLPGGQAVPAPE
jgi:predicted ATP-grasp superfamily ATP-dependent carboligase